MHSFAKIFTIVCVAVAVVVVVELFVLPRLFRALLGVKPGRDEPKNWRDRVELRYQIMHTSVWMFAHFKLRLDPMFHELPELMKCMSRLRTVLDLGCGYGFAGSSLLEWHSDLKLYGIDPNPYRVRMASIAFRDRGEVFQGRAPDFELSALPSRFDAVFILDVIHFLPDSALDLTLRRIRARLDEGGYLVLRAPILPDGIGSLTWNVEKLKRKITGSFACYRTPDQISDAVRQTGFKISRSQQSGTPNHALHWIIATASSEK
jgi:SAM-dependent methyltransferase